jgi:hypothetical protein
MEEKSWFLWWQRMSDMKRRRIIREVQNGDDFGKDPWDLSMMDDPALLPEKLQKKLFNLYELMQTA